jgi:excisionase family DNA binding protein
MTSLQDAAGDGPGGWLTVKEAAARLGVSPYVVRRMIKAKKFTAEESGEIRPHYYIPAAEVERALAQQQTRNLWLSQARRLREAALDEHLEGVLDAARRLRHHAEALQRIKDEDIEDAEGETER